MTTKFEPAKNVAGNIEVIRPPPEAMPHLDPMVIEMEYAAEKGGTRVGVPVLVQFSNHCYTRTRKAGDTDEDVLFREMRKLGPEERVWCPERAAFSTRLPEIMSNLGRLMCLRGNSKEILYRVESPGPRRGEHWYVCMRLSFKRATGEILISVRSVHSRSNKPVNTRGGQTRGWAIFAAAYGEWRTQSELLQSRERKSPLQEEGASE